jgi:DNA-binding LacI/PurR family transcriptional regulator
MNDLGALMMKGHKHKIIRVTMDDVARHAGVDKSTVSRSLAGNLLVAKETRENVLRVAKELGYTINQMARGLRSQRSHTIAVAIPLAHDKQQSVADPFFMEMVAHIADSLAEHGYELLLSKIAESSDQWLPNLMQSRRADGVILIGQSLEHAHITSAAAAGIPLIVWGARLPDQNYITVGTDNELGGYLATHHMIESKRQHIAFVGDCRLPEIDRRFQGYCRAFSEADKTVNKDYLVSSDFEPEHVAKVVGELIKRHPEIDSIVATADVIAFAAIQAISQANLSVPRDIAVSGFDDIMMAAHSSPALTTVRQDIALGAKLLTEKLLALIRGETISTIEMKPSLIIRASTSVVSPP